MTVNEERIFEMVEALVDQQQCILIELRKIVQGNAANFDQLRELRMMQEKKSNKDLKITYGKMQWCENCKKVHSTASQCKYR